MGIVKKIAIGVGSLVVLGIGIGACASQETKPVQKVAELPVTKETPSKESAGEVKKEEPKKSTGITKENYDKAIQGDTITGAGGSTIEEVQALMGEEPTFSSTTDVNGVTIFSCGYNAFETGESLTFTFSNGRLAMKAYNKF